MTSRVWPAGYFLLYAQMEIVFKIAGRRNRELRCDSFLGRRRALCAGLHGEGGTRRGGRASRLPFLRLRSPHTLSLHPSPSCNTQLSRPQDHQGAHSAVKQMESYCRSGLDSQHRHSGAELRAPTLQLTGFIGFSEPFCTSRYHSANHLVPREIPRTIS